MGKINWDSAKPVKEGSDIQITDTDLEIEEDGGCTVTFGMIFPD